MGCSLSKRGIELTIDDTSILFSEAGIEVKNEKISELMKNISQYDKTSQKTIKTLSKAIKPVAQQNQGNPGSL